MKRLLIVASVVVALGGCVGVITSNIDTLRPRTAGIITVAAGVAAGALATAMWIDDDPGKSTGCGADQTSICWSSRAGALVFAVPALTELITGTRSLLLDTYPWRHADDSTP